MCCILPDLYLKEGGNHSSEKVTFTSPGYPEGYADMLNCEWIFETTPGNHLGFLLTWPWRLLTLATLIMCKYIEVRGISSCSQELLDNLRECSSWEQVRMILLLYVSLLAYLTIVLSIIVYNHWKSWTNNFRIESKVWNRCEEIDCLNSLMEAGHNSPDNDGI